MFVCSHHWFWSVRVVKSWPCFTTTLGDVIQGRKQVLEPNRFPRSGVSRSRSHSLRAAELGSGL